jgi:hypothetical protein
MRASGRLWTIKPWFSKGVARLLASCWMLPEVSGWGRWWAVGDSDCSYSVGTRKAHLEIPPHVVTRVSLHRCPPEHGYGGRHRSDYEITRNDFRREKSRS